MPTRMRGARGLRVSSDSSRTARRPRSPESLHRSRLKVVERRPGCRYTGFASGARFQFEAASNLSGLSGALAHRADVPHAPARGTTSTALQAAISGCLTGGTDDQQARSLKVPNQTSVRGNTTGQADPLSECRARRSDLLGRLDSVHAPGVQEAIGPATQAGSQKGGGS